MAQSVAEKLRMLRSFVGDDYSEKDLSTCLSQSLFVVEVAAEKILTGRFQPSTTKTASKPSVKRPASTTPPKNLSSLNQSKKIKSTPRPVTPKTPNSPGQSNQESWLLCERWVSDGICTQRHGSLNYQENLQIEGSEKMVRFRAARVQGQFPKNLSAFLGPLLKENIIQLEAQALMELRGLMIGSEVPFALRVWITNPKKFFSIFDSSSANDNNKMFFGKQAYQKKNKSLVCHVAFALLQWAHHGQSYDFDNQPEDESLSGSDNEEDEDKILDEEEAARTDQDNQRLNVDLKCGKAEYQEADPPDDFGCELRQYQKEALWRMMLQEQLGENEEATKIQLEVLRDLVSSNSKKSVINTSNSGIQCDCGPVLVKLEDCQAPAIEDNGSCAHLNHPLWERRFLCSADRQRAVSFYVQPLFGLAVASTPSPPRTCRGGILADAMGMGKSVMLLALIQKSKQEEGKGTTLIVAPLSLLSQWEEEVRTKTSLSCRVYYGDQKLPDFDAVDVILTTYGSLQSELQLQTKKENKKAVLNTRQGAAILRHTWKRVVLDEAHTVKNTATVASRACCLLQAERKWCVSGTIIQNSLDDVYALLKFLGHEPWNSHAFWKAAITKEDDQQTALERVGKVISPIMIRRTKDTLDKNGNPIIRLPAKEIKTIKVEFSPAERQFYDALFRKSLSLFEGFIRAGTASKSWLAIFSLLHRLRQSCDHVALTIKSHIDKDEWSSLHLNQNQDTRKMHANNTDAINSKFFDDLMKQFKSMQSSKTQPPGALYANKIAKMLDDAVNSKKSLDECAICLDPIRIYNSAVTPCFHIFCNDCIRDFVNCANTEDVACPVCSEAIDSSKVLVISKSDEGKTQTSYMLKSQEVAEAQSHDGAARQVLESALHGAASSSKLAAINQELENIWDADPGSKVLIFSQFLGFLDLLESSFSGNHIPFFRLDGKLSLKERTRVLREFESAPCSATNRVGSVLLLSMKCGGVGLNLTAARACFIADPWWNFALEEQCIDRIHRIGQTAEKVQVRKFYVADSVEERIIELQNRKKSVATAVLRESHPGAEDSPTARPTLDDFKILFQNGRFG